MSYQCSICADGVPPATKMKRHVVKRPDGKIERELSVCASCDALLRAGNTLAQVIKIVRTAKGVPTPLSVIIRQQQQPTQEGATADA